MRKVKFYGSSSLAQPGYLIQFIPCERYIEKVAALIETEGGRVEVIPPGAFQFTEPTAEIEARGPIIPLLRTQPKEYQKVKRPSD